MAERRMSFAVLVTVVTLLLSACVTSGTPILPTSPPTDTPSLPVPTPVPSTATPMPPTPTAVPTDTATPTVTRRPTATPIPLPAFTLNPGDFYFSVDGIPSLFFSRNIAGYQQSDYDTFLDWTKIGGSKLVRIHLDSLVGSLGLGYTRTGAVDESWAKQWDRIFDKAQEDGVYILPVFSAWFDWNAGGGYSTWELSALNEANGGPAKAPGELFQKGSTTQQLFLQWMQTLVQRWQGRKNILAWEVFSEVNLASGASESTGMDFVNSAVSIIRAADPSRRPVTASLADTGTWPNFYRNTSIDFINIHPYPPSAQLDRYIVSGVRQALITYNRPVFIGESGLNAATPDSEAGKLTIARTAPLGVRHAIWAGIVSGALNGRSLWWEDSYAIYFPRLGMPFVQKYADAERPAVDFVRGVDFSDFKPLMSTSSGAVWGAVVGNENSVIGWYRDASCEPPDWTLRPVLSGQTVTLTVPGSGADWRIDFYDTKTGTDIISSTTATRKGDTVTIRLPDFTDDIAFKMHIQPSLQPTPSTLVSTVVPPMDTPVPTAVSAPTTTDSIAGKWTGTIFGETSDFSTRIDLSIRPSCEAGRLCGTVSAPQLPCSGELFLQEMTGDGFVFIERNMTGASSCVSGGYEYLQLQPDGTLAFKYLFTTPSGEKLASNGVLKRP